MLFAIHYTHLVFVYLTDIEFFLYLQQRIDNLNNIDYTGLNLDIRLIKRINEMHMFKRYIHHCIDNDILFSLARKKPQKAKTMRVQAKLVSLISFASYLTPRSLLARYIYM